MKPRLVMDTTTGQADLAWALVQLFFLMAFIAARPVSGLGGQPVADEGAGQPITVRLLVGGGLVLEGPDTGRGDVLGFLPEACAQNRAVVLICADDTPHRQCRDALARLAVAGPGCTYSY